MRILVVEDDPILQTLLHKGLMREGHDVDVVGTGERGLDRASRGRYDAMVLDLNLPDLNGLEVARQLRQDTNTIPILMVTARDELRDRLSGFAAGADDYLIKPFYLQEVLARLQAITRRTGTHGGDDRLVVGDLVLDRRAHEVTRSGQQIHLAPKEYAVLALLMTHAGQTLSRATIMERVWDYGIEGYSNVVDVSIRRLREAIDRGHEQLLIQTVHGLGYKIKAP
jgi:two-component system, OmpR family, response regulator